MTETAQQLIRCRNCGAEAPASQMESRQITQRGRNPYTNKAELQHSNLMFCKGKPCGSHYQMGCEG